MTDKQAAEFLGRFLSFLHLGRGNGKTTLSRQYAEAVLRASIALERGTPRPVEVKGRIFKRRYCPSCRERVRPGRAFCPGCGQAYRERTLTDDLIRTHITPPPTRGFGYNTTTIIFDETSVFDREGREDVLKIQISELCRPAPDHERE